MKLRSRDSPAGQWSATGRPETGSCFAQRAIFSISVRLTAGGTTTRLPNLALETEQAGRVYLSPGLKYASYVPHGLVVSWTDDGLPAASFGTQLNTQDGKKSKSCPGVRIAHRMAKREGRNTLRILPLHLAMEGFLAMHFGGPEVAWNAYAKRAISRGLDPRWETAVPGQWVFGLREALRIFEIHENQVGSLVFVADALASAFVVSHPEDYHALHRSLLEDFYGELLYQYSLYPAPSHMKAKPQRCINSSDFTSI